jgi:hypothetical protein
MDLARPLSRAVGQRCSALGAVAALDACGRAKESPSITCESYGAFVKSDECGDGRGRGATAAYAIAVRTP